MPKIKLIWVTSDCYDCEHYKYAGSTGDWQEVSQEELDLINKHQTLVQKALTNSVSWNTRLIILEEENTPIRDVLGKVAEELDKAAKREAADRVRLERARKERAAKAAEKKRKQYEKLKKEFGEAEEVAGRNIRSS